MQDTRLISSFKLLYFAYNNKINKRRLWVMFDEGFMFMWFTHIFR